MDDQQVNPASEIGLVEKYIGKRVANLHSYYGHLSPGDRVFIIEAIQEVYDYLNGSSEAPMKNAVAVREFQNSTRIFEDWYKVGMPKFVGLGVVIAQLESGMYLVAYEDRVLERFPVEIPF